MATSDRKPFETATVLDQALLDESFDNLVNQIELIVDIDSPLGELHFSDRNKYVDGTFYEARATFPIIERTIGEFLSPTLEFSQLSIEINNADEKFNSILPGGASYDAFIGRSVSVKMGLRDVGTTYTEIFRGRVSEQGGFSRSVKSFTLVARNNFEQVNQSFPTNSLKISSFPDIEPEFENVTTPIIYGDFTTEVQEGGASVPAIVVNGLNANVNGDTDHSQLLELIISENANVSFDTSEVYVVRGDVFYKLDQADIVNVSANNNSFSIRQAGTVPAATSVVDGDPFEYQLGERFFVKVIGKDLSPYTDNIVEIGRDILLNYGGLVASDFDANWNTYRDKSAPAVSAISTIKARAHIQTQQEALSYVLSLFEQVRLEFFIDRNLKFKISSLHIEDFEVNPAFRVKNWDLAEKSFVPKIDDRNNFNRARGSYNFVPNLGQNYNESGTFVNAAAVAQVGRPISKLIVFPNLYVKSDVENQLVEILRISSATIEIITTKLTWRGLLLDIGNFVKLNIDIQSTQFEDVPALIREVGYDPDGIKIPVKLWSFQMLPFDTYNSGSAGIVGGSVAVITQE